MYELGYLYTSPEARGQGLGNLLMGAILEAANGANCFATTRVDNAAMHYLFKKSGYIRLGNEYSSDRGDYSLGLFGIEN